MLGLGARLFTALPVETPARPDLKSTGRGTGAGGISPQTYNSSQNWKLQGHIWHICSGWGIMLRQQAQPIPEYFHVPGTIWKKTKPTITARWPAITPPPTNIHSSGILLVPLPFHQGGQPSLTPAWGPYVTLTIPSGTPVSHPPGPLLGPMEERRLKFPLPHELRVSSLSPAG